MPLPIDSPFALATVTETVGALERRDVSARELLRLALDRVEALNPSINAVITLAAERGEVEATAVDDARATGLPVGPIAGVPITIKDALSTGGIRSTGGAAELADNVPETDATVVGRVRDAGAVVFGKTNLPRWSGDVQSYNEMFGITNNPWDPERTPGGSSGGAAAAVATGLSTFEIGTDIGGSVRIPASNCGVYGHKPSFGVVPTDGYLDHPEGGTTESDVNVFGPFARSIDDLELVFDLIMGPNDVDATAWRLDLPPTRAERLSDFRVAAWIDDEFCPVDDDVAAILEGAVGALEDAGCSVDRSARPPIEAGAAARLGMALIGTATNVSETEGEWAEAVAHGHALHHRDWMLMHRARAEVRARWEQFFSQFDVVLCPVAPVPPIRHQVPPAGESNFAGPVHEHDRPYIDLVAWTSLIGAPYLPVTVPPVARTASGLPVGMQVVGPYLEDRTTIAFARAVEPVLGGYEPPAIAITS